LIVFVKGTSHTSTCHYRIWMNTTDQVGNIMSAIVWVLIIYSCITISFLAHQEHLPQRIAMTYNTICLLALACHAKTMFTDPGGIPSQAIPRPILFAKGITTHAMCSHCQTYKPPNTHHCRICNRCISRMDHHCPWMNNCVGAGNFSKCCICCVVCACQWCIVDSMFTGAEKVDPNHNKDWDKRFLLTRCCPWCLDFTFVSSLGITLSFLLPVLFSLVWFALLTLSSWFLIQFILTTFATMTNGPTHFPTQPFSVPTEHFILFLIYIWIGCVYALIIFAGNYFFCASDKCMFPIVLMQLVRFMTVLCIVTLLFVSSMLMNVTYGIMTGVGTIDRLKKKATDTVHTSDEEPIQLKDVFGIEGYYTWWLPIDPILDDYDRVVDYSIPARLKREVQMLDGVSQVTTTASDYIQPPIRQVRPSPLQQQASQRPAPRPLGGQRQTQQLYPPPSSQQQYSSQPRQPLPPLQSYNRRPPSGDLSFSSDNSSGWDNP
jgi:hypothetical protein